MEGRLVLCDIDGTLVDTGGAGLAALQRATVDVFGGEGPPLDLRGATDGGLVRDLLAHFGEEEHPERVETFYRVYLGHLEGALGEAAFGGRALPGVIEILTQFRDRGATLGLLTGNIARGAALKTRHYGLDHFFSFGAYGDDHHDRNRLGPVALERAATHSGGSRFSGEATIVLGDTPRDIACGREIGAFVVCVATGAYDRDALQAEGADLVFTSFEDAMGCVSRIEAELVRKCG